MLTSNAIPSLNSLTTLIRFLLKQPINDDSHSTSDSTADLSPIKGGENDSRYDDKFDLYFASAYLPHISVGERDDLDRLVESPSLHCQAFEEAGEMEVPPSPPQNGTKVKLLYFYLTISQTAGH